MVLRCERTTVGTTLQQKPVEFSVNKYAPTFCGTKKGLASKHPTRNTGWWTHSFVTISTRFLKSPRRKLTIQWGKEWPQNANSNEGTVFKFQYDRFGYILIGMKINMPYYYWAGTLVDGTGPKK
jgi:hypothetical protein